MSQTNKILGGGAALQLVLVAAVWWPRAETTHEAQPLIGLASDAIDRIEVLGTPDDDGTATTVDLRKDGARWAVASAHDYPADPTKVDELVEKLTGIEIRSPTATQATSHASLNVGDNYARKVVLHAGANAETILIGAASGSALHVRRDGEDDVYTARGFTAFSISDQAQRYWDSDLLGLDFETVDSLTVTNPNGSFTLEKGAEGWSAAGEAFAMDSTEIDGLARRLTNLRISEVVGEGTLPDLTGALRVEWTATVDEQTVQGGLTIGATADNQTNVLVDGDRWAVKVSSASVERWTEVTLDDLKAEEQG